MTITNAPKPVSADHWKGRLSKARGFLRVARTAVEFHEPGYDPDTYRANVVLAAIAYIDTLTAALRRQVNQNDHQSAVKLLRAAMGNKLPNAVENKLRDIIGQKDQVEYGARLGRLEEASRMMEDIEAVAEWAEQQISEIFPGESNLISASTRD